MVERGESRSCAPPGPRSAAERWAHELAEWRDEAVLAAAPESPYRMPAELFRPLDDDPDRRPHALAREALGDGGTVLDVGCGAGAGSLLLAPPAVELVGVDPSAQMLSAYRDAATERGIPVRVTHGRWPDVAAQVPPADVVVCRHVLYNVPDLVPFARALTAHARRRVVVELAERHPWVAIGPLWQRFHGQPGPTGPTAELAAQVLAEGGVDVRVEHAPDGPWPELEPAQRVAMVRRQLCLPPDRDADVATALSEQPPHRPDTVAVLWWDAS